MAAKTSVWAPPVSFYFKVVFQGAPKIEDVSFMEVGGLREELEVAELQEGGENNYFHQVPKRMKHGNLVLKRALEALSNPLEMWIKETLEGGFARKIKPRNVVVMLLDAEGKALRCWWCLHAYPVKWEVSGFHAQENKLAIETLELCYTMLERKK